MMKIQVVEIDPGSSGISEFHVYIDDELKYKAVREYSSSSFWILTKLIGDQEIQVDRDKYSNDLIERITSGRYGT